VSRGQGVTRGLQFVFVPVIAVGVLGASDASAIHDGIHHDRREDDRRRRVCAACGRVQGKIDSQWKRNAMFASVGSL